MGGDGGSGGNRVTTLQYAAPDPPYVWARTSKRGRLYMGHSDHALEPCRLVLDRRFAEVKLWHRYLGITWPW